MRHFEPEVFDRFRRVIPHCMKVFDAAGVDPSKEIIEIAPRVYVHSSNGQGGLKISKNCEASIPGLFASGVVARNAPHGIYSVGGVNLAFCNVSGYRAGENGAKFAIESEFMHPLQSHVNKLKMEINKPTTVQSDLRSDQIFDMIRELTIPAEFSLLKNRSRIRKVLSQIRHIKINLFPKISASDPHELVKVNELRNYLSCVELIYSMSLERTESRECHYREEYPYRDDKNWLKLIVVEASDTKGISHHLESVPLDEYRYKPDKMDKIPYPIDMPKRDR
jgi:succinate dehydrogenase/fumarate reductase flavoprotein subunit